MLRFKASLSPGAMASTKVSLLPSTTGCTHIRAIDAGGEPLQLVLSCVGLFEKQARVFLRRIAFLHLGVFNQPLAETSDLFLDPHERYCGSPPCSSS